MCIRVTRRKSTPTFIHGQPAPPARTQRRGAPQHPRPLTTTTTDTPGPHLLRSLPQNTPPQEPPPFPPPAQRLGPRRYLGTSHTHHDRIPLPVSISSEELLHGLGAPEWQRHAILVHRAVINIGSHTGGAAWAEIMVDEKGDVDRLLMSVRRRRRIILAVA